MFTAERDSVVPNDETGQLLHPNHRQAHRDFFPQIILPRCMQSVIRLNWSSANWKKRCIILLLLAVICNLIYIFNVKQPSYIFKVDTYSIPCEMPVLNPFEPGLVKDIKPPEPFKCDSSPSPVFVDKENVLQFNLTALEILQLKDSSITCTCKLIQRADNSDDEVVYSEQFICTPTYNVPSDFFKIRCISNEKELLNTMLTKIFRSNKTFDPAADDFYNVILFGIDSMSRNSAIRQIPRAVKYLHSELSSIDLMVYNRVGGHTFDNLIPMLTGFLAKEEDIPYLAKIGDRFEMLPLIWKNFSRNNYATFFAEDVLQFHTFNTNKEGFKAPPTDHYMRPFWMADYESRPTNFLNWKESFSSYNKRRCLGNIPKYLVQINYLKQFMHTYRGVRKFALSHLNDLSHQNINDLHLAEDDLIDLFRWTREEGHLNNTFLIVYSDHGPRGQSQSHQALQETNLPFLSIVPPFRFRDNYPDLIDNLKSNTQFLTTHFDLFATLRDILGKHFTETLDTLSTSKSRGISLFRDIGKQRSCSEASIPEQFCMCYRSQKLNITNNALIQELAQSVVEKVNQLTSKQKQCAFLHLKAVVEARVLVQERKTEQKVLFNTFSAVDSERDYADYKIVVETLPGNAQFFATSKIDTDGNRYVLDSIERINRYNNQSHCVNDEKLKPLCYCNSVT